MGQLDLCVCVLVFGDLTVILLAYSRKDCLKIKYLSESSTGVTYNASVRNKKMEIQEL